MKAIGLMSGTSMDGIDVALLETDGEKVHAFGPAAEYAYTPNDRHLLEQALSDAKGMTDRDARPGCLADAEDMVDTRHKEAAARFLQENGLDAADIGVLGYHGQTVLHRPEDALTVQLGRGARLATETGIDTVFDMRAADMRAGGQGAPLVPVFHAALAKSLKPRPVAFVNIGGISNVTWVGSDGGILAFDSGPGNALVDQWVQTGAGIPFDQGGRIASEGGVVETIVKRYMASPYFAQALPKSLDRFDFKPLDAAEAELSDGARTLIQVTVEAIWAARDHMPEDPALWLLCGGGRKNDMLVSALETLARDSGAEIALSEAQGFDGDAMEAQAFAYLAVRSLRGLPLTLPTTTGCTEAVSGGVLAQAP